MQFPELYVPIYTDKHISQNDNKTAVKLTD